MDRRRLGCSHDIFSSLKSEWERAVPVGVPSINLVRKYRVDSAYLRTNRFLFWELNYSRAIFQFHMLHLNRWLRGHVTPVHFSLFYFHFLVFPVENSKFKTLLNNFQTIGQIIDTGHRPHMLQSRRWHVLRKTMDLILCQPSSSPLLVENWEKN